MIYTMIILTAFLMFLLIRNIRNTFAWIFIFMIIGIDICIFAILIYLSKTSTYNVMSSRIYIYDLKLFILLSSIRINYFLIFRILNAGIVVYLSSILLFIYRYTLPYGYIKKASHILKIIVIAVIPQLLYLIIYDPKASYRFYLLFHIDPLRNKQKVTLLLTLFDIFIYLWIIICLVYPIYILVKNYRNSKAVYFRRRNITFMLCLSVMNLFFFTMFFTGSFRNLYIYSSNFATSLVKHAVGTVVPSYYYSIMPLTMLIVLTVMIIMLLKNRGLETVDIYRRIFVEKNIAELNRYFRGFLHGFKNTFFSIKILSDKAMDEMSFQPSDAVKKINEIASNTITSISKMLNSLTDMNILPKWNNLCDCLDEAVQSLDMENDKIVVEKIYDDTKSAYAYFDFYLMKTVFMNILRNSVETLGLKGNDDGRITINVSSQVRLVAVSITDNGMGIKRSERRKIFDMFYTTKSHQKNWGVGLVHVANIVKKHMGIISVYSDPGKYTTFEIILNTSKENVHVRKSR